MTGCRLMRLSIASGLAGSLMMAMPAALAAAVPGPEVEYTYDVMVRRHFSFPNNDAIAHGYSICDKVARGEDYPRIMAELKVDVTPNDEQAANYVVSNAVGILCPARIPQLRESAARDRPPQ
jgi:Protein of unknown function (DUF732)